MSYSVLKKLPPVESILQEIPLSLSAHQQITRDRREVKAILEGRDDRLLMIVGPCSAWPKQAVLEYANRLVQLNEKVKNELKLIMRVYIQKPRTTKGWTGPVNQPDLFSEPDIAAGIKYTRDMMIKVIEMGLPIADEALFTHNAKGFLELLSWVAIGARSSEDQEHRIFASALDCAVGLKNPTHGSLAIGVNSIIASQHSHVAVFDGYEVQTHGNHHAHMVLRGSNNAPNYSIAHLKEVKDYMDMHQIVNPSVIVDVSHDNCLIEGKKNHQLQPSIALSVLESIKKYPELNQLVKGFMVESFIKEGNQKVDSVHPEDLDLGGLSITDPCLSWEQTENFLLELAELRSLEKTELPKEALA
ncbi:3-deoxy-7-phosphoheptulonate synthase [Fluoribacter gormanii]|uniref:Phospho-2-dehydro-3-deoxyheptonate aldolase n=1 Tax=Fluoribacter gormanii TaxID=464 RepID=A0A377GFP6_9GAMM|nr:3-deoxy-7-phosphoheptulonate synthase [Fluoribacter gormanii]KTD02448.1 phospho-2-dehydro-3-deoxyheptonate aldolase [Fluoribacter gormanii]MCW8444787.1 3-deoxy-7-phosphoheptulonate synthase [Fluoribacter gormanii]MCW8469998.1 3-deoxy-7-phosphoheptulonate synthase [Fluoribacter gormanii]SIR69014.1 3-deoxy-D-arabinoheptulosonate-7-phosphate synthase [Fluoribacter gormanii]STO23649.1 Phospho-2-dehydro-3-deoxyheptonate aldolase, Tyr-sensitive [Fluoribacter gormanii]